MGIMSLFPLFSSYSILIGLALFLLLLSSSHSALVQGLPPPPIPPIPPISQSEMMRGRPSLPLSSPFLLFLLLSVRNSPLHNWTENIDCLKSKMTFCNCCNIEEGEKFQNIFVVVCLVDSLPLMPISPLSQSASFLLTGRRRLACLLLLLLLLLRCLQYQRRRRKERGKRRRRNGGWKKEDGYLPPLDSNGEIALEKQITLSSSSWENQSRIRNFNLFPRFALPPFRRGEEQEFKKISLLPPEREILLVCGKEKERTISTSLLSISPPLFLATSKREKGRQRGRERRKERNWERGGRGGGEWRHSCLLLPGFIREESGWGRLLLFLLQMQTLFPRRKGGGLSRRGDRGFLAVTTALLPTKVDGGADDDDD